MPLGSSASSARRRALLLLLLLLLRLLAPPTKRGWLAKGCWHRHRYRRWGSHSQVRSASRPEEMGTAAGAGGWARAARAAEMEDIRAKKRADEDPTQCIPSLGRGGGFCGPNLALALTLGLQPCT